VDAKNAFDGYIHSMRSATEGSGDNKGLSEKMDSEEKAWHGNIKGGFEIAPTYPPKPIGIIQPSLEIGIPS